MSHIERFKKSFEILKFFTTQCPKPVSEKAGLIPVKYLRQENVIDKKECLRNLDTFSNILISSIFRNHQDFNKYLSISIELLFILCNNDDSDIRNAVLETFDKLILNLIESNSNRLLSEICKAVTKPSSSRALRLSLTKFSEICHRIRPNKYRAFASNLYTSFVNTILESNDELLQEALYNSVCKIFPLLSPYATEREILEMLNAYLFNLSLPSNTIRRFSAMSIVILCEHTRKPYYYFNVTFNFVSNLISSSKPENKDFLYSGIFMLAKCSFRIISQFLDKYDQDSHSKIIDSTLRDLSFLYQQMISTIKYATSNILIISTLEALIEFFNTMPPKIFTMFSDLCDNDMEYRSISSPSYSFKIPSKSVDNDSVQNFIENINDDIDEENFQKSYIFFNNSSMTNINDISEASESTYEDNYPDNSSVFYDQESEIDNKSIDNKASDLDITSESSLNTSHKCPQSPFDSSFDLITDNNLYSIDFNDFNLGEIFSFEHTAKLICIKYLLKGQPGQLLTDNEVRVSIKSLAISSVSSIIHLCPQILFEQINYKNNSQLILDIFLYLNHSDPNIKSHVALIIGKYLRKCLSYSFSYEEFLQQNNISNHKEVQLDYLLELLRKLIFDQSSITVRHVLMSFQYFLPELILHNDIDIVNALNIINNLISLKNSSYWLIKVELINLFSKFSFKHLKHFEYLLKSAGSQEQLAQRKISDEFLKNVPISKLILEEIVFNFLYDNDHRVRQALFNSMSNFIENLCLNNYVFYDDSINSLVLDSMLTNYYFDTAPKLFDGSFPTIDVFEYPLESNFELQSMGKYGNLKTFIVESNIAYFVKKFTNELRNRYHCKLSLTTSLSSLSTLAKLFPPGKHLNGWMVDSNDSMNSHNYVEFIQFLIELLSKNQMIIHDLTLQQHLIELIISLIEAVCLSGFKSVQNHQNRLEIDSTNDLHRMISPNLVNCIETYFLCLYKIMVIYCSINEDNILIFTNFIHNLYTKNVSISTMIKKHSSGFFDLKDKDVRKEPMINKGPKKREAYAYDSSSFKLFDLLKSHRHRSKTSSTSGRSDRTSYLQSVLDCFAKLLEFTSASFLCNHLEDILIYLKMIFYLNPYAITLIVNKLLKCLFEINYVSMFIDAHNMESSRLINQQYRQSKSIDLKSFYNICFVIPYMNFNDIFNHLNMEKTNENIRFTSYLGWLRKRIEYKHIKIMNSDITNPDKSNGICLKKFLTSKIQCFEPLVIQSMKHYTLTSDTQFQSCILDLLVQLIQFHINYSLLDSGNIFLGFIMKQFEHLENVHNAKPFELLMKHVFYFLTTASREHYIPEELVSSPKIIQLCDNLIANGHEHLAIDGLYIIIDHLFYSNFDNSTLNSEYQLALETQREVILAYCFKLINFNKTFHLLTMILNHYKNTDRTKWTNLSKQIIEIVINKLLQNTIKIDSIEYFQSLQSLIFTLSFESLQQVPEFLESMFNEFKSCNSILFKQWQPKVLIYLKLILSNLNEMDLLSKIDRIKCRINIINLNPSDSADCFEKINAEDVLAYLLLNLLQKFLMEIENDLMNNGKSNNEDQMMSIYFLRYYQLILAFVFQSGFYPKLTKSAICLLKQPKADLSLNNEVFEQKIVNDIFLKLCKFYPMVSISWLNFLYILNYDKLPKILSKCIENNKKNNIAKQMSTVNMEILKRSSLILLCDYLSENLDNVEFLSWFVINHLRDIIEHCHEMPIKEFINAIHRKPVSSGLLLQVITSRCDELLSSPIMSNKILFCLERSHNRQNIALIMFLLEKYLCNPKLTIYYKCCKYAESIITTRLTSIYDTNYKSSLPFNHEDFNNLLKILKHTSYNKLYFTCKMIRIRFYDIDRKKKRSSKIKDPLSERKITVPEIDKNWFIQMIQTQMSLRQKDNLSAMNSLNKLDNDDLFKLIFSDKFSIKNFVHILRLIVEKSLDGDNKTKINFNRKELAKSIIPIYVRFMKSVLEKFPLKHYFSDGRILYKNDIENVCRNGETFSLNLLLLFLPSFEYFLENLSFFENYIDSEALIMGKILHLTAAYSSLIYLFQMERNYQNLINIIKVIECCLSNRTIYLQLSDEKNIYLQLTLINSIHFTFKQNYPMEEMIFPVQLHFEKNEISTEDYVKLISMFHSLEMDRFFDEQEIPLYKIILEKIVLMLCRLPLFNPLVYIPYNVFTSKNEHIWNAITPDRVSIQNVPIISSQFICDPDTFKQFMFRVSNLGFTDRRQFEEIWMTLLGVFSESFSMITQNKQTEELNEFLILSKLVIMAITNLLYNARTNNSVEFECHSTEKDKSGFTFGAKFDHIQEIIRKKSESIDKISRLYNEPFLNRTFFYTIKPNKDFKLDEKMSPSDSTEHEITKTKMQASIDLYSCIQFLIDFYSQQIKSCLSKNNIHFPIVSEIARSSLIVSELFVDKNQYKKVLELFNDLQKVVENYEDELLNQFVSTGLCKFYSIFSTAADEVLDKHKKIIIERNFKEFFLPTRIYAIQSVLYLAEGNLIKNRDLLPLLDYITKHLHIEHVIPSSYCKEYVNKLVNISFALLDCSHSEIIKNSDNGDKFIKGLIKLTSKDINIEIVQTLNKCFEQLIIQEKINIENASLLRNIVLKRINTTTNQSYTIHMLNLLVCTSYFVGCSNFDLESQTDTDELFKTMEKLSIIFEPLKWCNSLEANVICRVMGYFLSEFFPAQDILNKCIGEFLSKQQNHYKYLINILYIIYSKLQADCQQNDTAQDWVILSLSSFTQLVPISHALWALTCFLICASQNHWIRSCYFYFQNRFGKFSEQDKQAFFLICNNFYNEIKSDDNRLAFIKTFQKAACLPNSPYIEVLQYLCDT